MTARRRLSARSFSFPAAEAFGIQRLQTLRDEASVFPDEFSIELNGAAAVIGSLNVYHVPMDLGAVPVVGFFVGLAGREME